MLTKEENELLTQVGPGMPAGELLRRYWQPVALSEELKEAPIPVRIMGEDLVLYRDEQNHPALLGRHCPHRGADLSYGRLEDGGLRCLYHGWLYDVNGRCLEQPGEPEGSDFSTKIKHVAYPCSEKGGVVLTYMGPGDPPLIPSYEFLMAPEGYRFASKYFHECSYLQGNEGNLDPIHNNLLHHPNGNLASTGIPEYLGFKGGRGPIPGLQRLDLDPRDFGLALCDLTPVGEDRKNLRTYNFMMPNMTSFPGPLQGKDGYSINWHVPIDDTHHWKYTFMFRRSAPLDAEFARQSFGVGIDENYHLYQRKENRYQQNRATMRTSSYTGIDGFAAQDVWATEGMGPITDRTNEHLGYTDKILVGMRKLLMEAIQDVQEGVDPRHVIRDPAKNSFPDLVVWVEVIPNEVDWRDFRKQLVLHA